MGIIVDPDECRARAREIPNSRKCDCIIPVMRLLTRLTIFAGAPVGYRAVKFTTRAILNQSVSARPRFAGAAPRIMAQQSR